ncbi:hypothetical protein [Capnocytophaga sputigena]|uniref:hypothetical protein n=1 Tax=Capnocytophaga sputigena TaxID=1019 RepID=UPI0028D12501|nr:hypothetical protein [Capnocytophaga sputigena]
MEPSLKTDTTKILKKLIKFYKERNISEEEEYEFTEGFVDKYLSENNKASLLRTLGLTANAEAFAQHYLLKGEETKGVNKLVQGLYWMYKCIQLQNFYNRTTPFLVYKFGYAMGISWLLGKDEILETIMAKFEEFLRYEKTTMVTHSFHTSFLYLLYKKDFTSLEKYFDNEDSIYVRLLVNIEKSNQELMPLLIEACDNHLIRSSAMSNKVIDTEFCCLDLYPYEIFCYLLVREKMGFEPPVIPHKLMETLVATADLSLATYHPEDDVLLMKILSLLERGREIRF